MTKMPETMHCSCNPTADFHFESPNAVMLIYMYMYLNNLSKRRKGVWGVLKPRISRTTPGVMIAQDRLKLPKIAQDFGLNLQDFFKIA